MRVWHLSLIFSFSAGARISCTAVRIVDHHTSSNISTSLGTSFGEFERHVSSELSDGHHDAASTGVESRQVAVFWSVAATSYAVFLSILFFGARLIFGKEAQPRQEAKCVESGVAAEEVVDSSSEDSDEEGLFSMKSSGDQWRFETKSTLPSLRKDTEERRKKEKLRRRVYKTQWLRDSHAQHLKEASFTLLAWTLMMIWYRTLRMLLHPAVLPSWHWSANLAEFLMLALILAGNIFCLKNPTDLMYWPLFVFYCFYIPAVTLPPFQWSCRDLERAPVSDHLGTPSDWFLHEGKANMDCSLQGTTAQELFMASILTLPWLVPRYKMLKTFGFLWILGVYLPWSVAYTVLTGENVLSRRENVLRFSLLATTMVIALVKKFYLEKNARNNFVAMFRRREAGKKMYAILNYMLPSHVIVPMLENPESVIAEHVPRVSILFIVIADFDAFARRCKPKDLLEFLNNQFTKFDELCAEHGVTKIETVGEEYVCCVGVTPEEQNMQHKDLLQRLFSVADSILSLHSAGSSSGEQTEVRVKMGLHTGPIVAGVIGKKLPRYRLFGDTINTAARMMQKSEVGKLQFGEETFKDLPSMVECKERGDIEMKGKGLVKTYFFEPTAEEKQATTFRAPRKKAKSLCAIFFDSEFSLDMPDPHASAPASFERNEESEAAVDEPSAADATIDALTGAGSMTTSKQRQIRDFEDVLQRVTMQEFTPEMEQEWYEHYHVNVICKKIGSRLNRFLIGLLVITAIEGRYTLTHRKALFLNKGFEGEIALPQVWTFFTLRGLTMLILLIWRLVVVPLNIHLKRSPWKVQSGLTACTVINILLIWCSYEALTTNENSTKHLREPKDATNEFNSPFDQKFVLDFVLVFYAASGLQHFLFKPSLIFVILAAVLPLTSDIRGIYLERGYIGSLAGGKGLDFPFLGKALFITIAMSNALQSYQEERSSRARFKARREVEGFKVRIEDILNTLMPRQIVKELKSSPANEPPSHEYQHATIAQSDLCGFTKLASTKSPQEVVELIGEIFGAFDALTDTHDVYKVETVGDAYIAGLAESTLTANKSPASVIRFGLDMAKAVDGWAKLNKVSVRCRVGIHHGACIGGIVGNDMQRYHLFGDLMTGLEVLESTAPMGAVQVSSACKSAVEEFFNSQKEKRTTWTASECEESNAIASPSTTSSLICTSSEKIGGGEDQDGVEELKLDSFVFDERTEPELLTSKGEVHEYAEVGGKTYIVSLANSTTKNLHYF